jgi:hypothetical protein
MVDIGYSVDFRITSSVQSMVFPFKRSMANVVTAAMTVHSRNS